MDERRDVGIVIRFDLRAVDVARSRVWSIWRLWSFKVLYVVMASAATVMVIAALTGRMEPASLPSLVAVGVFLIAFPVLMYGLGLQLFRSITPAQRSTAYEVSSERIVVETGVGASTLNWQAIQAADETSRYFYLWPHKGVFWLVPKRGFETAADVVGFRELLRQKLAKKARVRRRD